MKSEMETIGELVRERKVDSVDALHLIKALDESEERSVWEQDGEFDPRRFSARLSESFSNTMLDDIVRVHFDRLYDEALAKTRELPEADRAGHVAASARASPPTGTSLLAKLRTIGQARGFGGLGILFGCRDDPDFADSRALGRIERDGTIERLRHDSGLVKGEVAFEREVAVEPGTVIRMHRGYRRLEIAPSATGRLRVLAVSRAWAATTADARRAAEEVVIRVVPDEGTRCWIINNLPCPVSPAIDLRLEVPSGVGVGGGAPQVTARGLEGDLNLWGHDVTLEDCRGDIRLHVEYYGTVVARGIRGKVEVDAFGAPVCLEGCRADVKLRTVISDARILDFGGRCTFRSIEGSIDLADAWSSGLWLKTKRGSISVRALLMAESEYELRTKEGDIAVALDPDSDCGLNAESQTGVVVWRHPAQRLSQGGDPRRVYANVGTGSGFFSAISERGTVTISGR